MSFPITLPQTVQQPGCEPILEAIEITKSYSGVRVLDRVSFDCRQGEVHALVGENGAGKSTLMRILAGAVEPDAGEIRLCGKTISFRTPRDALKCGISLVHQEFTLISSLRLDENLLLGCEPTHGFGIVDKRRLWIESKKLLARVRLPVDPHSRIHDLRIGQQQKAEFAKALAIPIRVLLLDEPTAALDEQELSDLFELIRQLREQNVAIVYISHRLEEIFHLADRITVLKNGQKVITLPPTQTSKPELIRYMVGREVSTIFPERTATRGDTVVEVCDLAKENIFAGVNFTVRAGEVLGIAGLAGSGRSALGRVLAGISRPSSGTIRIHGKMVCFHGTRQAISEGVVFSPQDRKREGLALDRPAYENLALSILYRLRATWLTPQQLRLVAAKAAPLVGLPESFINHEVRSLSGGSQQKVMIGRALAANPKVVIFDEPSRGVDVGARAEIYSLIRRLADEGAAVIVISSELPEIVGLSDRVLVMRRGLPPALFNERVSEEQILHAAFDLGGQPHDTAGARRQWWHLRLGEAMVPVIALIVLFLIAATSSASFLQLDNLENLGPQTVVLGLISLGQMFVILTGGIDLSVGAVVTIANLVCAEVLLSFPSHAYLAVFIPAALGITVGVLNATLIRLYVPPFLATFAMLSILQGVSFIGFPASVGPVPSSFWQVSTVMLGPISWATLGTVVFFVLAWLFLRRTTLGRHLYAFGADPVATRLRGIGVFKLVFTVYCLSGVCAALAGVYLTARIGSGLPNSGQGMELNSIAAVMVGGASLYGGQATVLGTAAGVTILTILDNIFNLMGINTFYQGVFKGLIILLVATVWALTHRD